MMMSWPAFNWADYVVILVVVLSTLISLIRGFVREFLSLAVWMLALWLALRFSSQLAHVFSAQIHSSNLRLAVAFTVLFVGTLVLGTLLNFFIVLLVEKTGLSGTDRLLGTIFGFCRGILVVAVMLLVARFAGLAEAGWWQESQMIAKLTPVESWLQNFANRQMQHYFPGASIPLKEKNPEKSNYLSGSAPGQSA